MNLDFAKTEVYIAFINSLVDSAPKEDAKLYAGLTVMCRELNLRPFTHCGNPPQGDMLPLVASVFDMDRKYWVENSPLWEEPIAKVDLYAITEFSDFYHSDNIVHEWTTLPGQRLFAAFAKEFKKTICEGPDSIHCQINNGLLGQAALPTTIVATLMTGLSGIWLPIMVYVALLITKTGINTYCNME